MFQLLALGVHSQLLVLEDLGVQDMLHSQHLVLGSLQAGVVVQDPVVVLTFLSFLQVVVQEEIQSLQVLGGWWLELGQVQGQTMFSGAADQEAAQEVQWPILEVLGLLQVQDHLLLLMVSESLRLVLVEQVTRA